MRDEGIRKRHATPHGGQAPHGVRERVAVVLTPIRTRPFVRLWGILHGHAVALVLVAVGLSCQFALLWMAWELLDLVLSVMEVWAELARKHLEITL